RKRPSQPAMHHIACSKRSGFHRLRRRPDKTVDLPLLTSLRPLIALRILSRKTLSEAAEPKFCDANCDSRERYVAPQEMSTRLPRRSSSQMLVVSKPSTGSVLCLPHQLADFAPGNDLVDILI